MPVVVTLIIAKLALLATRLTGRGGSALPGLIADKIDPHLARKLSRNVTSTILVTGTNGKTTTTKMLVEILRAGNLNLITNQSGSNLKRGITSRLIEEASLFGKINANVAVFEVDEASLPAVADALRPTHIAILNLFRDQLDRYGELDTTARLLGDVLASHKGAQVLLNADDPLVASLADNVSKERVQFFGVEASDTKPLRNDATADSSHSPYDGTPLIYTKNWFGHLGHYKSQDGSFVRPKPGYSLKQNELDLAMDLDGEKSAIKLPLPGLYNAYNALAAAALATKMGVKIDVIKSTLGTTQAAFGRVEQFEYEGRQVYLLLIKNPTGFNQVIQTFLKNHKQNSHIMIAINDNFADGRDVSWLWDSAVEEITGKQPVMVSGTRAYDMALRLKYADRDSEVNVDLLQAFERATEQTPEGGTVYVLPTYTAMMTLRKWLATKVEIGAFHE
jgi:UDP-N-acetylmuramyl tripeptide synthase